jgi:hypothetical protein
VLIAVYAVFDTVGEEENAGRMILPASHRYFAPMLGTAAGAKFRGGVGEIISPTS